MSSQVPVILIQGGAGADAAITQDGTPKSALENGVKEAARRGYEVLDAGGSALDAVEAAVKAMEDDPTFNAGKGSCLTTEGEIEMNASIMDGKTLNAGSVAGVSDVANPVGVARLVLDKTDHVMIIGDGASELARRFGAKMVDKEYLITPGAVKRLKALPHFIDSVNAEFSARLKKTGEHDTVGAVALDGEGNMAYATSTGGITAMLPGRVGDSPIIGSGGYADNEIGASSSTGYGEANMKTCLGHSVITLIQQGKSPQEAAEIALKHTASRANGFGGVVALDKQGRRGIYFTTKAMAWAYITRGEVHCGIYPGEDTQEKY